MTSMISRFALALVAALGAILLGSSQISAQETAQSPTIAVEVTDTAGPIEVEVSALDIAAPGLGAWTIDVIYEPIIVTVLSCEPGPIEVNVCNAAFADGTVRIAGATRDGLEGDAVLASISFECATEGEVELGLSVQTLADATVGDPQPIDATLQHDTITCGPPAVTPTDATPTPDAGVLPDSGTGGDFGGGGSLNSLVAALAAAGLVAVAGAAALRQRTAAIVATATPTSEPSRAVDDAERGGSSRWLVALAGAGVVAGCYALRRRKR